MEVDGGGWGTTPFGCRGGGRGGFMTACIGAGLAAEVRGAGERERESDSGRVESVLPWAGLSTAGSIFCFYARREINFSPRGGLQGVDCDVS